MRKLFSIIAATLFATTMFAASAELYTLDATLDANKGSNTGYAASGDVVVGAITWSVNGNNSMAPWRIGGKSLTGVDRTVHTKTAFESALDSVVLEVGAASGVTVNSLKLIHSTNADFSGGTEITASFGTNRSIQFAPAAGFPANSYYKFVFNVTITATSSNKFIEFKKVHFWGQAPEDPTIESADALDLGVVFGNVLTPASKVLEITAYNLTEDIAATLTTGTVFNLASATVAQTGGDLTVNFAPSATGEFTDNLTLASTGVSKTVTLSAKAVKTEHAGTNADPFTVDETIEVALAHASGVETKDSVSVKGVVLNVINLNDGRLSFSIGEGNDTVYFYRTYDAQGKKTLTIDTIATGDTVLVRGRLQNYQGTTPEVAYGKLLTIAHPAVIPTTYAITVNQPAEGGTISADVEEAEEGATVTLTATPDANYVFGAWNVKDADNADVTVTNNQFTMPAKAVTVSAVFQPVPPVGCDWDNLPFFNTGIPDTDENYNQFKICKEGEQPNVVNIQTAGWADNHKGIYASYPSAVFGTINIDAANYTIQGAGILFHLDAFTANETEVSVVCDNVEMVFTVLNTKAITPVVPIEITIDENVDLMDDLASTGGFWLLAAQNDDFTVVIGNANAVTELAGTYTVADLDAESYIKTATDSISFVSGSITVEELAGGIHFRGTIEGNDGEFYLLSISKALVGPTVVDVVAASPDDYVRWTDAVASQGWWQIYGDNGAFSFSLSNTDTDDPVGTYGIDDLDPNWCYVVDLSNTADTITFSDGEVVVAIDAEGVVTVTGELLGSDGKTYAFDLTYQDPTAETTVNVTIAEGELDDTYLESAGLFGLAGIDATNNITAQFYIWTEDGMAGDYTEEDLDNYYFGSGIMVGTTVQEIFSATLHVAVDDNNEIVLTADVLCYNNTLYRVTLTVPGETPQPTYAVTFAQPQNGTLVVKNEGVAIASGDEFEAGTVLTVEATPADGFVLSTLTAGGVDIIDAKRFTIVDAAVEVVATFVADPTGINNVEGNQRRIKAIENGQLFINVNGVRYNVNGARVK